MAPTRVTLFGEQEHDEEPCDNYAFNFRHWHIDLRLSLVALGIIAFTLQRVQTPCSCLDLIDRHHLFILLSRQANCHFASRHATCFIPSVGRVRPWIRSNIFDLSHCQRFRLPRENGQLPRAQPNTHLAR